jgi:hypothetical protein
MTETGISEARKLRAWFLGNEDPVRLVLDLFEVSQLVDDFVDDDQGHDLNDRRAAAVRLLHLALVRIPANPFFDRYKGWLAPLLSDAVLAWDMATDMEKASSQSNLAFAYVYRDQLERLIVQIAQLIGGVGHARQVQGDVFDFFRFQHPDGQTFREFIEEHAK